MPDDNQKSTSSTPNFKDQEDRPDGRRPLPPDHALDRDDWGHRRLRMDAVTLLFSGLLVYIIVTHSSTAVDQLAVPSLIAGVVSLIAAYVFGAVWDYKSFMTSISQMSRPRYREEE